MNQPVYQNQSYSQPYQQYQNPQLFNPQPFVLQQGQEMATVNTDWSKIIGKPKPAPVQYSNIEEEGISLPSVKDVTADMYKLN